MKKILSREEVERLWHNSNSDGTLCSQLMSFSAALESALREKLCGEPVAFVCSAGNPFAPIIRDKVAAQKLSDEHGDGKIVPLYALNRSKA
ncbi:Uncharacterised protein [Burkholderia pseudomallei]|uniref:hypothetical protein n=1 Tax=Burkholderia pseudomallei TaxID=28450 RepID=UPI000F14F551|nr:hypothetical protein [Burkholderia pseudomallei]CAJ3005386.1 Uncharacterised protein [Burkholderia pseudomallei]CAJ6175186.1 Uncharacterised protein [Burkholderia pseudomallei]CAJ7720065.1 Uncharacterised protein [Burkholderia pseudomallei]VBR19253.1 Uncharacterised protein [Burkholderia pseudomallei]